MSDEQQVVVRRERVGVGVFGSLELPVGYRATVESTLNTPFVFRYLFGFSIVAVTGGQALADIGVVVDDTFAKYAGSAARWSDDDPGPVIVEDGVLRRMTREFVWTDDYLEMVSVVSCVSDNERSMILNGSCPTNVGPAELATVREVVASARLPQPS